MTVIKNKATSNSREFWSHVERIAEQTRNSREMMLVYRSAPKQTSIATEQTKGEASAPTSTVSQNRS